MGLWKLALALLIGASLTESGRKTLRNIGKQMIDAGQSALEKGSSTYEEFKTQTTKLIEEIKCEQKDGTESASKNKQ